jgi:signal transduction histidine kinase
MRMATPADGTGLTYEVTGPLQMVVADKHFLQLAILNVVQNSVKYRRPGVAPHIVVSQDPQERGADALGGAPASALVTRFRDNGLGVKKTELRRMFEPFVRGAGHGGMQGPGGFGLGLALVAKVMAAMGGRVWAESPPGTHGTVLCLELPAAATAPASTGRGGAP